MNHSSYQLSLLIDMTDPIKVLDEVKYVLRLISKRIDLTLIEMVYKDMLALFLGEYPGYNKCDTVYHNTTHTTDTVIAMARLIHGAFINGKKFSEDTIILGMLSPILHDTGYIQRLSEKKRGNTGAVYTINHIQRSNQFAENYFKEHGLPSESADKLKMMIQCTGLNVSIKDIKFASGEIEFMGKALGTADLLGQMAERAYVEKLLYLYDEFQEGGIPGYSSEFDFLLKTQGFYQMVLNRFTQEYDSINVLMRHHFMERWHIQEDLYEKTIQKNIAYIKKLTDEHPEDYRNYLRRDGYIVKN